MLDFGLIDDIVKEPLGGAHTDPEKMAKTLKSHIKSALAELLPMDPR
jgi:acetyl-CoA carboxylase carboxyl transferase subunit alpha